MVRLTILISALACLASCKLGKAPVAVSSSDAPPKRIVSLDYCADQFVLKFADKASIRAVSPDAVRQFSYMRDAAVGLPSVRPNAEDVLLLQPDLVVRSYGGGPNAGAFFEKAGVPVLQVGFASDMESIKSVIRDMSAGLGDAAAGEATILEMDRRLASIPKYQNPPEALYMTPSGVTSGTGTQVDEMLQAAGLGNFQKLPGWRSIPLERLAYEQPDVVAAAFFETLTNHPDAWSAMKHPVAKRQMRDLPTVPLQGAWTSCGSWFLLDAIEALSDFENASALGEQGKRP